MLNCRMVFDKLVSSQIANGINQTAEKKCSRKRAAFRELFCVSGKEVEDEKENLPVPIKRPRIRTLSGASAQVRKHVYEVSVFWCTFYINTAIMLVKDIYI